MPSETLASRTANQSEQLLRDWRRIIRWHRDQSGDDRCWLDDYQVYEMVLGLPALNVLFPPDQRLSLCRQYHRDRSSPELPCPSPRRKNCPRDYELRHCTAARLAEELEIIRAQVQAHHDLGDGQRTAADDRALYAILPDGIAADQRLPAEAEFLPSCEKFFDSRTTPPKLHEW